MRRILLLVALAFVLSDSVSTRTSHHRCTVFYGIARVCNASAATPGADKVASKRFVAAYMTRWNKIIGKHGFPMEKMGCAVYGHDSGRVVFSCAYRFRAGHRYRCRFAEIRSDGLELGGTGYWIPCTGELRPRPAPPAA